jgi:Na+-transporting NADH:ubiquinone oxidoreductase subunit NqrE
MTKVLQKRTLDAVPAAILMGMILILYGAAHRWNYPRDLITYAVGCGIGWGLAIISMTATE